MYKIGKIEFKNWDEYEIEVNQLFADGWAIDETLVKNNFGNEIGNEHIVRLKSAHC